MGDWTHWTGHGRERAGSGRGRTDRNPWREYILPSATARPALFDRVV